MKDKKFKVGDLVKSELNPVLTYKVVNVNGDRLDVATVDGFYEVFAGINKYIFNKVEVN